MRGYYFATASPATTHYHRSQAMPEEPSEARAKALANKRRQTYWRNRRTIDKLQREGSRVEVGRMSIPALWSILEEQLHHLLNELLDGNSPRLYEMSLIAWEAYAELMLRGDQLRLFPTSDFESPSVNSERGTTR